MSEAKTANTMLYKIREDGTKNEHAWNLPLDTKVVEDDDLEAHQKEGWITAAQAHAHFHAPKKAAPKGA